MNVPSGFHDSLAIAGDGRADLEDLEVQIDLDVVFKSLDTAVNNLVYRCYGGVLLDILIVGGLLALRGIIQQDGFEGMV